MTERERYMMMIGIKIGIEHALREVDKQSVNLIGDERGSRAVHLAIVRAKREPSILILLEDIEAKS
jgi:hypothetical protein